MKKILTLLCLLLLILISCKSTQDQAFFKSSNLPGMIYDVDNRPCDRVTISAFTIDEKGEEKLILVVRSDINGRFTLPNLDRDSYKIVAERDGYESISTEINYSSRLDVLYLKIYSQKQILNLVTEALEEKRFGKIEEFLDRSDYINPDDPYHLYLKSVFLYEKKNYEEALNPLDRIIELGYKFPYVHLMMADIYQYELDKPDNALIQLQRYMKLIDDSEIDLRMKELEKI